MSYREMVNYKNDKSDQEQGISNTIAGEMTISTAHHAEIFGLCSICADQTYCPFKGAGKKECNCTGENNGVEFKISSEYK